MLLNRLILRLGWLKMTSEGQFHLMDVVIAEVPYDDGKSFKTRPALVVMMDGQEAAVYKITSKYAEKSVQIQKRYFPLEFWREAGLSKASYVDVHRAYVLATDYMMQRPPLGKLAPEDRDNLFQFITDLRKNS